MIFLFTPKSSDIADLLVTPGNSVLFFKESGLKLHGTDINGTTCFCLPSYVSLSEIDQSSSDIKITLSDGSLLKDPCINRVQNVLVKNTDGDETAWRIIFCKSANLHTFYIDSTDAIIAKDIEQSVYSPISLKVISPEGSTLYNNSGYIKGRGNSTWHNMDKRPFEIKLPYEVSFCDMSKACNWTLLANAYDPTKIRNKLIFDTASNMGMEYAIESDWIDLYINGEYWGNYLLCKEPRIGDGGLNIPSLEKTNDAYFNPATGFESSDKKGFSYSASIPDISGGYLLELISEYSLPKKKCWFSTSDNYFSLKSPDNASVEELNYIADYMKMVDSSIQGPAQNQLQYIDIDSFTTRFICEEFSLNEDATTASYFFYKKPDDQKLYAGPNWDYDVALGGVADYNESILNIKSIRHDADNLNILEWDNFLCENQTYSKYLKNKLERNSAVLSNILDSTLDDYYAKIKSSVQMDRIRWEGVPSDTIAPSHIGRYDSLDSEYRYLAFYIYMRLKTLEQKYHVKIIEKNPTIFRNDKHALHCVYETGNEKVCFVQDGSQIYESDLPEFDRTHFSNWEYQTDHNPFSYYVPILEDTTLVLRSID